MSAAHRLALSLLFTCGVTASLPAQIVAMNDFGIPEGSSYFLDFSWRGPNILTSTQPDLFSAPYGGPLFADQPPGHRLQSAKLLVFSDGVEGMTDQGSVAMHPTATDRIFVTSFAAFQPAISSLQLISPFDIKTWHYAPLTESEVGTITFDSNGGLYLFQGAGYGIWKMDFDLNAESGTIDALFTFGDSGPGALTARSYGLSVVNDVVYALDLPGNRITRYDATDGTYLGDFAVTGAHADSDIAVSKTGRLYLSTGNGDGTIYDAATGTLLDTFISFGSHNNEAGGRDGLLLNDSNGYFYLFDDETGGHSFYDPALVAVPEPATYAGLAGLSALGLVALRRRRPAGRT